LTHRGNKKRDYEDEYNKKLFMLYILQNFLTTYPSLRLEVLNGMAC